MASLPLSLSVRLSVRLPLSVYFCLSVCLSFTIIYINLHHLIIVSVPLFLSLSPDASLPLSLCLCICLSVSMSLYVLACTNVQFYICNRNGNVEKIETRPCLIWIGPVFSTITTTTTTISLKFETITSSTINERFPTVENEKKPNVTTTYDETLIKQNSMLIQIIFVLTGFLFLIALSKMQI